MNDNRKSGTDAYRLGFKAFFDGKLDNPYSEDTWFGKEWARGFNTAYFRNIEKSPAVVDHRAS
jgi:hypothetical protein